MEKVIKDYMTKLARKGGVARREKLTAERRKEIAKMGAQARIENLDKKRK